jgi:hypothetical protein
MERYPLPVPSPSDTDSSGENAAAQQSFLWGRPDFGNRGGSQVLRGREVDEIIELERQGLRVRAISAINPDTPYVSIQITYVSSQIPHMC